MAWEGKAYDVTPSRLWAGGWHAHRHRAGRDLTADLSAAPHGPEVLERFSLAGRLAPAADKQPEVFLEPLLRRFPMLRRHPHPMTVHFPTAFLMAAPAFALLFLATGRPALEVTAYHLLGAGLLSLPVAAATGFYNWWLNYGARPMRAVRIKIGLAALQGVLSAAAFAWRTAEPGVLAAGGAASAPYLALLLAAVPIVAAIGWYGASLTFPTR